MKSIGDLLTGNWRAAVIGAAAMLALCTSCQVVDVPVELPEEQTPIETPEEIVEPEYEQVGAIAGVGPNGDFVVIRLASGSDVTVGEKLSVMFAGAETAVVKVAPQRDGQLVTADKVYGSPSKGSGVFRIETPGVAEEVSEEDVDPVLGLEVPAE
ncbi:hypothetical protein [Sulfuriroseicoccus oceanibius]|uniref:Uncharacterized protein n=1 Tax=Sulfuriroseicoccus oceanibius TaxID=2707525 RepID=A0A6B3L8N4_9BACT|nr:hypothetical protein [Sulfuriroseicoccus oceanibius]QQL44654.1 hypothetical protein G3M56_012300 [Sulfuriroseicoccus oceanibius]